ncbi:hypothetical protein KJS94_02580 [Flavihumibacter rivuli]|uniref:hypothetical protein n=1 Tax=Flavihumibacter rivuli TaxID=2838156 RepID=UPI001BDE4B65|nr:hypothetical protein [Flavihumibacter rivuli]ULQ57082.1 hypothetical protein KJS94_02580 [Flavihumibacter rivuli]
MGRLKQLIQSPRKVLLIDGLGATLTMTLLFLVVLPFRGYFGLPQTVILGLAFIGLIFAIYSFGCYFFTNPSSARLLIPVIIGNTTYCLVSLGIVIRYIGQLTLLGTIYFLVEIVVVGIVVYLEWLTVKEGMRGDGDEQD